MQEEFTLLGDPQDDSDQISDQELFTSPVLTRGAYVAIDGKRTVGQYGVLGKILGIGPVKGLSAKDYMLRHLTSLKETVQIPDDPRLYLNTVSCMY